MPTIDKKVKNKNHNLIHIENSQEENNDQA